MKRAIALYAAALGTALWSAGCAAPREPGGNTAAAVDRHEEGDENARKMLDAFLNNDAEGFVGVLPAEMQSQFGVKDFANSRNALAETLGQPVDYSFDTMLEHPLLKVSVWKVRFERRGADGETIRQQALFRVISGVLDGRPLVISFNFL